MTSTSITKVGRIPVVDVWPVAEAGRFPAKAAVGEAFAVQATVFREGHDAVAATVVLTRPDGSDHSWQRMRDIAPGLDRYEGTVVPDRPGDWTFRVEGWSDPYATWVHDAALKVAAGVDVELMLTEGALLLGRAAARRGPDAMTAAGASTLKRAVAELRDTTLTPDARLAAGLTPAVRDALAEAPLRELVTASAAYPLRVDRPLALHGSWYELFPRSHGATYDEATGEWTSGTLRTAADELPRIAQMGFDVVYLTPIHPIGTTHRKGRNNSLDAQPGDPGSPYAIGSADGGHDAIEPSLGTFDDFDAFVARAASLGLEVALDVALQCSPDHPWVTEHPEWFTTRADGTIAYAENPPKKYQDIYPLNFDNDPEGIAAEIRRVLQVWIDHGVTLFRVDNPHTKPLSFWEWLLADVRRDHPDVIFLSEAFTRPSMMLTLAKVGFHQSYTYFTWRNTKEELEEYLARVGGEEAPWLRPSFWPTTHDILPPYLQQGGVGGFAVRAVLAATGSPTWGVYSGYELVENVPRPGVEEQVDNEKYEFRPRDWSQADRYGISLLIGRLNEIRRTHPALQQLRNVRIHPTSDPALVAFSRHLPAEHSPTGRADTVVVVVNIDPWTTRDGFVQLDLAEFGLAPDAAVTAYDVLSRETYEWGPQVYVRLDPQVRCAHVVHLGQR
ncbi:alpha-1,4-glucan:maltose-1-phosphate maltosyltransferase [Cellulomonas marina]|uniref:Alpha-1,4-glucan:maltose-1-phosphate maltosyltransferase n=1 Tax=Cellulomonas marina TaxID=988821 RepID=A0A1I0YP55_9CELL|nr:alpha-1,4-glucan--maltose-1-phosphate maltosyltransferase [Cellulomonas marina]GIG30686.1 alpha-1,4-glucan:maltose-1-phosphate maltosyltransferase [Cellulomonas marina]SFB13913.1 starch synthase (maltosyl-transferring) [Cellulomonas marina]